MMSQPISETDLILNADGSIYHLNLLPGDVANTIITVGDPDRVTEVSRHFDFIEVKKGKREFITHTGTMQGKRLTVISTGIGTDNIDIVLTELDSLVNIDLKTRRVKPNLTSLNIIRIGTSGAIQSDIEVDSLLVSAGAFGLDALMHYYQTTVTNTDLLDAFKASLPPGLFPYYAPAGTDLLKQLACDLPQGLTITAPGFYAPQGREVRALNKYSNLMPALTTFKHKGQRITNLEMETAGIYGMAAALGHQAVSFNVILANRANHVFSKDPLGVMDKAIGTILDRILALK
jgi:uridine phosphorylase